MANKKINRAISDDTFSDVCFNISPSCNWGPRLLVPVSQYRQIYIEPGLGCKWVVSAIQGHCTVGGSRTCQVNYRLSSVNGMTGIMLIRCVPDNEIISPNCPKWEIP